MRKWHRRLGLAAAIFVAWLSATGILVSHAVDLGLDRRHVGLAWLLDWYGVPAPEVAAGYRAGDAWVIQVGERIYVDRRALGGEHGQLVGAVPLGDEIVIAAGERLLVATGSGTLIETLGRAHGVPAAIARVGLQGRQLMVQTPDGVFAADADFLAWRRAGADDVRWVSPAAVPPALGHEIAEDYRRRILTLERIALDLHSGRLFGRAGPVLMDLAALAFFALAASGLWIWSRGPNASGHR